LLIRGKRDGNAITPVHFGHSDAEMRLNPTAPVRALVQRLAMQGFVDPQFDDMALTR
jgi:hypothetical protein